MKNLLLFISVFAVAITSCKTTEANYRAAYEKAMERDRAGVDSTVYAKIRNEAKPKKVVVGGDTLAMRSEYVRLTPDIGQESESLKHYNVVTGQFKQLFTAKNMRARLLAAGFDSVLIVQTREPLYYVVAASAETPDEAAAALEKVRQSGFPMRDPFPWVLKRP